MSWLRAFQVSILCIILECSAQSNLAAENFERIHDAEHVMHDIEEVMDKPREQLSKDERDIYFFNLHDTNKDNLIDGVELVTAYIHEHTGKDGKRLTDDIIEQSVDYVLTKADLNGDRYLTYPEFKRFVDSTIN